MVSDMNSQLGVNPTVAALSLFSTNFRGIETAMDFIFEREADSSGERKMLHRFVGYLPEEKES